MAGEIKLDIGEWKVFFANLSDKGRRLTEYLRAGASTFGFADIIQHFADEKGPSGAWPQRAPSTNELYDLIGSGKRKPPRGASAGSFSSSNKLLQLTGKMRQTISPGIGSTNVIGSGVVRLVAGTNYSGANDAGSPSRNLPQREFMWLSDKAQQLIANFILEKYLEGT